MRSRLARKRLWYLSAALLVAAIGIWAVALSLDAKPGSLERAEFVLLGSSGGVSGPRMTEDQLRAFLDVVAVFHGRGRAVQAEVPPPPSGPVRPPLSAFKVAMFIRDRGAEGDHGLVLRCKDPAHPETYFLAPTRADRGTALLAVRYLRAHAEFDVTRGKESFTFRAPLRPRADLSVLRARGDPRPPTAISRRRGEHRAEVVTFADASAAASMKILSHRDTHGRCVGIRITGIRPGGWANEFGLQVGDIIETEAAAQLKDPQTFRSAVRSGWRPTRVTVQRDIWGETHKLSVDGT